MSHIEIERKFLVPSSFNTLPDDWELASVGRQLNHYFVTPAQSVRTRYEYTEFRNEPPEDTELSPKGEHYLYMVRKWNDDGSDADNGTIRRECSVWVFPEIKGTLPSNLESAAIDLENYVDSYLLACGASYKSKWSRYIDKYASDDYWIDVEDNAGYGRIIEIEKSLPVNATAKEQEDRLKQIDEYGKSIGLIVLEDNLLKDMYKFYNQHWAEYYLTNKRIFDDSRFSSEFFTKELKENLGDTFTVLKSNN